MTQSIRNLRKWLISPPDEQVIKGQIVNYDTQRNIKILTDKCKKLTSLKLIVRTMR